MLERLRLARTVDSVVVATTTSTGDDPIVSLCDALGVSCFRGEEVDLLDRHYRAALRDNADVVVKIPSDCPTIDPRVVDQVVGAFLANPDKYDYLGNLHPPSWPDGQDVEVMPIQALATAWREATRPLEREHTTPFLWERPERFRLGSVSWAAGLDCSMSHRWTVDYPEDYEFLARVFEDLIPACGIAFSVDDVFDLLAAKPDLARINGHLAGVNWYRHHLDELRTVDSSMTRADR
jgi:spore coat polysaccharide biosynthesis protein SpsF